MVNGIWKMVKLKWESFFNNFYFICSIFCSKQSGCLTSFTSGFGVANFRKFSSCFGGSFGGETKNGSTTIISGFLADYNLIITDVKDKESLIPTVTS